jgi:hypothetical protein
LEPLDVSMIIETPAGTGLLPIWLAIADGSRAAAIGAEDRINRTMSPMSEERSPENIAGRSGRLGGVDATRVSREREK